jgi:hypothetical protein
MTPSGVDATVNVTSELIPITAVHPVFSSAQWYMANGWFYSPTGWANMSLSVDWYDRNSTYITTTNSTVSIAAATWVNLVAAYKPPTGASFASINVIEGSTPAAGNTLYFSNVTLTLTNELTTAIAPVAQIVYANLCEPTSVVQLA